MQGFTRGYDPRRKVFSSEDRKIAQEKKAQIRQERFKSLDFEHLSIREKRCRVLEEQNFKCLCGIAEWLDNPLTLELDHIDGNHFNNVRENLRILCPNCHSQTPTFRNKRRVDEGIKEG